MDDPGEHGIHLATAYSRINTDRESIHQSAKLRVIPEDTLGLDRSDAPGFLPERVGVSARRSGMIIVVRVRSLVWPAPIPRGYSDCER